MVTSQERKSILPETVPVRQGELAVVVGAGASGLAAARLLHSRNVRVRLLERSQGDPSEALREFRDFAEGGGIEIQCGPHQAGQLSGASLVVYSPGIPLQVINSLVREAENLPDHLAGNRGPIRVMGEMELALAWAEAPILAVTGSSGKTTTVSLAAAMLEQAGKKVFLGGNIGTPLSSFILEGGEADVLVLELSSFQLQGNRTIRPHAAILLNLTENHLDHHTDMAEYTEAKLSLFRNQTTDDLAILPPDLAQEYSRRGFKGRLELIEDRQRFASMKLTGKHNALNAEAAWLAVREFGVKLEDAARAAAAFEPLRHRLEMAGEVNGVRYINDSKCTTVDSLRAALESFDRPVLLLAGGKFKGGDLAGLRELIREKVRQVILFGDSREIFTGAWEGTVPLSWHERLEPALAVARLSALPGEVVLLSPATASYDLYENYKERGDHFCRLVREMA